MNVIRSLCCAALVLLSTSAHAATWTIASSKNGQNLVLRREGTRLVLLDQTAHRRVASADARTIHHVVIQGAPGPHNDALTVEVSSELVLSGGIDYDGGDEGWDT